MKDNTLDNKIELVLKPKGNYKQNVSESNVSNCEHVSAGNLAIRIKKKIWGSQNHKEQFFRNDLKKQNSLIKYLPYPIKNKNQ